MPLRGALEAPGLESEDTEPTYGSMRSDPKRVDPCTALVRETTFQATRLAVLLASVGTWSMVAARAAFF